eukprot:scaffold321837_cov19-Tisochrysis_lutea.AAC.2
MLEMLESWRSVGTVTLVANISGDGATSHLLTRRLLTASSSSCGRFVAPTTTCTASTHTTKQLTQDTHDYKCMYDARPRCNSIICWGAKWGRTGNYGYPRMIEMLKNPFQGSLFASPQLGKQGDSSMHPARKRPTKEVQTAKQLIGASKLHSPV